MTIETVKGIVKHTVEFTPQELTDLDQVITIFDSESTDNLLKKHGYSIEQISSARRFVRAYQDVIDMHIKKINRPPLDKDDEE